ncbi:hypothetical protein cyc_07216 [Cyclospora cayetanensis]|uniref:Copper-fist domain-containing protein n=1 Tax=Cyclospora cayetanensis TaxID=88456 RepID=A0A1D3D1M3_9EIME|nr:hypothetical protein cyc_07216 [Cyclospora cayetanensis]
MTAHCLRCITGELPVACIHRGDRSLVELFSHGREHLHQQQQQGTEAEPWISQDSCTEARGPSDAFLADFAEGGPFACDQGVACSPHEGKKRQQPHALFFPPASLGDDLEAEGRGGAGKSGGETTATVAADEDSEATPLAAAVAAFTAAAGACFRAHRNLNAQEEELSQSDERTVSLSGDFGLAGLCSRDFECDIPGVRFDQRDKAWLATWHDGKLR